MMGLYSLESMMNDRMSVAKRRNSCPPQAFEYANGQDWRSLLAQHGRFLQNRVLYSNRNSVDLSRADFPLTFHPVHGDNVELSADRRQAKRGDSFCKGICFSGRPIAIGERVFLKFVDTSGSWSGVLRFGFTSTDPGTQRGEDLPRYACPDMTNRPGNWAKALGERYAVAGNELFFYVTRSGDVFYGVNGEEKGLFFSGVNTSEPVWALLDIYGNTGCVEFTNPLQQPLNNMVSMTTGSPMGSTGSRQANNSMASHVTSITISDNRRNNREAHTRAQISRFHGNAEFSPLPFHNLCGRNIRISPDQLIATRTKDEYCNAYVFTSRPLRCGEKIVVQVQGVDRSFIGGLAFGFTSCDPTTLKEEDLPDDADLLLDRLEYWVVNKDVCRSPEIEDELGFHLTNEGEVQYSRNNHKWSTLMHVDRTLPLWAFFDVYGNVQKIKMIGATVPTLLPPRPMPRSRSTSSALMVTLPPPPPQRHSMVPPMTLNLGSQVGGVQGGMSRSISQPAPLVPPSPGTPASLPPLSTPATPSSINDPVADNENNECNVCYERPVNAVLYTCGHMCMCFECAQAVRQERNPLCPICRGEIKDVIKIYRS
ncbi:protein neuralized-like isoform X1 [Mya arenaria]|uniref:protein neuralized-like isoform X1 n=1 Tax=Mya arenaria TaxID=6604 RepID=UPI0022E79698|nr:protein neuralized-like isoform X1 [Mya arenaria]